MDSMGHCCPAVMDCVDKLVLQNGRLKSGHSLKESHRVSSILHRRRYHWSPFFPHTHTKGAVKGHGPWGTREVPFQMLAITNPETILHTACPSSAIWAPQQNVLSSALPLHVLSQLQSTVALHSSCEAFCHQTFSLRSKIQH